MKKAKRKEGREGKSQEGKERKEYRSERVWFTYVFQKEEKEGNMGENLLNKIITEIAPNFKKIFPSKYRNHKTLHINLRRGECFLRHIMLKTLQSSKYTQSSKN